MKTDPQLHHVAKRITPRSLERVIEAFELFGCKVKYRQGDARWAMVGQEGLPFNIQLAEVDEVPRKDASKIGSHIGFISNTPAEQIEKVEKWALEKEIRFEKGGWSERELWFDLPDLFVDFVVEVMHVSITEE
jgi:hypothetical protein